MVVLSAARPPTTRGLASPDACEQATARPTAGPRTVRRAAAAACTGPDRQSLLPSSHARPCQEAVLEPAVAYSAVPPDAGRRLSTAWKVGVAVLAVCGLSVFVAGLLPINVATFETVGYVARGAAGAVLAMWAARWLAGRRRSGGDVVARMERGKVWRCAARGLVGVLWAAAAAFVALAERFMATSAAGQVVWVSGFVVCGLAAAVLIGTAAADTAGRAGS